MPGSKHYNEGQFPPERGADYNWHVYCNTGAIKALETREHVQWLIAHPGLPYIINFANRSAARIEPGHPLWQIMAQIAKDYAVEVFSLNLPGEYVPWAGDSSSLRQFEAIRISKKPQ